MMDQVAYGIGLKYVEVALFTIPNHGYYENGCRGEKVKSVEEARRVVELLQDLVRGEEKEGGMDDSRRETVEKLALVAKRSYEDVVMEDKKTSCRDEKDWETMCTSWKDYVLDGTSNLCSLLEVLDCGGLGAVVEEKENSSDDLPVKHVNEEVRDSKKAEHDAIYEPTTSSISMDKSKDVADDSQSQKSDLNSSDTIGPPLKAESSESIMTEVVEPPKATTDTYISNEQNNVSLNVQQNQTTRQSSDHSYTSDGFDRDELSLALNLSKQQHETTIQTIPNQNFKPYKSISDQTKLYQQQFHSLVDQNKVHIRFLDTYQGRIRGSTNGCTVIAPLTCIQYFVTPEEESSPHSVWNAGIPDDQIHHVIDIHAPTVLEKVRTKLNLPQDSFIIPSDVHDHLMEVGLLSPSSFVGVCGGNILDDEHLLQLKQSLLLTHDENECKRLEGRKIASNMFFHGHVVALHVIRNGERVWIELIDSLPNPEAWMRSSRHSQTDEGREPEEEWETRDQPSFDTEDELPMNAVRIRCTDMEHFDTLVRQYALSKFSHEERKFIDKNQWEDNNSHFDPRVFQAFIWNETE